MLDARKAAGKDNSETWGTPIDVFNWWMQYDLLPGQMSIDDFIESMKYEELFAEEESNG